MIQDDTEYHNSRSLRQMTTIRYRPVIFTLLENYQDYLLMNGIS